MIGNKISNYFSLKTAKLNDTEIAKHQNNHNCLRRTIAKVIKSKNKKFIKKIIYIESITKLKIISHHRFTLFRYIEIEGFF